MATFTKIKTNIRINLEDVGVSFHSAGDVNTAVQEAYDDIAILTRCIIKKRSTASWSANTSYYKITDIASDAFYPIAIYDNSSRRWLEDNVNISQLDRMRADWEVWEGSPRYWLPVSHEYIAVVPRRSSVSSDTFDFYYAAFAETVVDTNVPNIISDMQYLIEEYATADLLEAAEELSKAVTYWRNYYNGIEKYSKRVKLLAKPAILRIA